MTVSLDIIRNQYQNRKTKELNTEAQLRIFLRDAIQENILADYDSKRRMIAESIIGTMEKLKKAQIESDTALDLNEMQKLRYIYSAKDARQLTEALEKSTNYQDVVAICESARSRNLNDLADAGSQKAVSVGERGYLSNPGYRDAVKSVRRAVAYLASNFFVKDVDSIMAVTSPPLIPIGDIVAQGIGDSLDGMDANIVKMVTQDIGTLPDPLTPALRNTLINLDK